MKIALIGYGKMGAAIERLAHLQGIPVLARIQSAQDGAWEQLPHPGTVAIEFTTPESAFPNVQRCLQLGVPVVCGTTGWLEHWEKAVAICQQQQAALFYASNFSIGVNLLFELNRRLAQLMQQYPEYSAEIHEIHHIHKRDAPSGTALTLAHDLLTRIGHKTRWQLMSVQEPPTDPSVLPIYAQRINEVPGTHRVRYHSTVDSLEIRHEAYSREGFAAGALLAARWVMGRRGVFGMSDLLGL